MSQKMEAKVKKSYRMGAVIAFSGVEFIRTEWRPVPAGFEAQATVHPLLDVRDAESQAEIHVTAKDHLADTLGTADLKVVTETPVTVETEPAPEELEEGIKPARRRARRSKASDEDE